MSIVNYSEIWECVCADIRYKAYDAVEDECLSTVRNCVNFTSWNNLFFSVEKLIEDKMNEFQY
jgi:hypothetical protein